MSMSIEEIASVHLGKAGDGSVVKPYKTPDSVDSSLLVGIPRHLNRTQYNIREGHLEFVGYDVWNCYEVSFLLANGMPMSGALKLRYPCDSENIVESKSLKLYLNSYNMEKFDTLSKQEATMIALERIKADLSLTVKGKVEAAFVTQNHTPVETDFIKLEDVVDHTQVSFSHYNENPDILKKHSRNKEIQVCSSLLRSNCRVTNQPDWGDVFISMKGDSVPTFESLLQYIVSMRSENHFHEEICECIFKRLYDKFSPLDLTVSCLYTRRGGIDINPVRTTDRNLQCEYSDVTKIFKTLRQ